MTGAIKGSADWCACSGSSGNWLRLDQVVDAHQNLRSAVLKGLFRLVGVPSVTIDKGRDEKKALTRKENKTRRQLPHSVERYA